MSPLKLAGSITVAAGIMSPAFAAVPTVVVDDFAGGPDTVGLLSFLPPEIATGTFLHGGAVGGSRDVVVISETAGRFEAGVAFGAGGYASFVGTGRGGIVYDGVPGITDANNDMNISADEFDYGLHLDLVDCTHIKVSAFADLPNAHLALTLATSATDYNTYLVDLTTVGVFADYMALLSAPDVVMGTIDWSDVNMIALYHEGGDFPNLDIRVNLFEIQCIPEPGTWLAMGGLLGVAGLTWARARSRKS